MRDIENCVEWPKIFADLNLLGVCPACDSNSCYRCGEDEDCWEYTCDDCGAFVQVLINIQVKDINITQE